MPYALIQDVPASWEQYEDIARVLVPRPPGLLLHFAGPTDEGIRTIEVWASEAAAKRFGGQFAAALAGIDADLDRRTIVRGLRVEHVLGASWPEQRTDDRVAVGPGETAAAISRQEDRRRDSR